MKQHDLLIIGAGPGGYVAAIRAAQLGLDVACIEKEKALGGTCLRVGCIPSKAMLESSEIYHEAKGGFGEHGLVLGSVKLDLQKMLDRKDRVVKSLTGGVASLFKKNKITRYEGTARFEGRRKVIVESKGGKEQRDDRSERHHHRHRQQECGPAGGRVRWRPYRIEHRGAELSRGA
jgi:dihydrolipoamide dehydrogenase